MEHDTWREKNGEIINQNKKWVKIDFLNNKLLKISLWKNDSVMGSKELHGRFKNGYFYVRPKNYIIPLFPIIFGYKFERKRIGKSNDKLIIDYSINHWYFFIMAGLKEKGYISTSYQRK